MGRHIVCQQAVTTICKALFHADCRADRQSPSAVPPRNRRLRASTLLVGAAKLAQQTRTIDARIVRKFAAHRTSLQGTPLAFAAGFLTGGGSVHGLMADALDHRATYGESICPYCGVGCRLWAEIGYGNVLRVKGAADA